VTGNESEGMMTVTPTYIISAQRHCRWRC